MVWETELFCDLHFPYLIDATWLCGQENRPRQAWSVSGKMPGWAVMLWHKSVDQKSELDWAILVLTELMFSCSWLLELLGAG